MSVGSDALFNALFTHCEECGLWLPLPRVHLASPWFATTRPPRTSSKAGVQVVANQILGWSQTGEREPEPKRGRASRAPGGTATTTTTKAGATARRWPRVATSTPKFMPTSTFNLGRVASRPRRRHQAAEARGCWQRV